MRSLTPLIFLLVSLPLCAQDPDSSDSPTVMPLCSAKQPQPCAVRPHAISTPDPEYSAEASKKKLEGTVVLELLVGADGTVHQVSVLQHLPMGLDEEAVKAVKTWKFEPATHDGKPVAVKIKAEVDFHIYHGKRR